MNRKKIQALLLVIIVIFALTACQTGAAGERVSDEAYAVKVVDGLGNPMSNVFVQLCKESCFSAATDDHGVAHFPVTEEGYKASIISMPEGYKADAEEFYFEAGATELTITLKPAA